MIDTFRRIALLPRELKASRARRSDLASAREALLAQPPARPAERRLLEAVSLEVHRADTMYRPGEGRHYLGVGLSALRCIHAAWTHAEEPETILDFASGYGRVLRFLRARFPSAQITASDIDPVAVRFCSRAFAARGVPSQEAFDRLSFPQRYDLIWCGSLLTHLSIESASALLDFLARHLSSKGVCAASTHGTFTLDGLRSGEMDYGLSRHSVADLLADCDATGWGFLPYGGTPHYGISVASLETIRALAERASLRVASVQHRGWDDHHDVHVFVPA